MEEHQENGHMRALYDNVFYIRGTVASLDKAIKDLSHNVSKLASAAENQSSSSERIIKHMQESLPVKFVVLICMIICLAFVGGGVLKELLDSHILMKLFG